MPRIIRAIPDGFAEDAVILPRKALAVKHKCSTDTAARWIKRLGLPPREPTKIILRPIPKDFIQRCGEMDCRGLKIHYRASGRMVTRWRSESGIAVLEYQEKARRRAGVEEAKRARAAKVAEFKPSIESGKIGWAVGAIPPRDDTIHGEAADFLRRKGWVVFRARTLRACASKDDWIVGRLTLPARDMVAKAVAKGFEHGR